MRRALAAAVIAAAVTAVGCGDDTPGDPGSGDPGSGDPGSSDRGAGVGALGGSARTETLARTRLARRPPGELVWVADETRLGPGEEIRHAHGLAFAYGREDAQWLSGAGSTRSPSATGGEVSLGRGDGAAIAAGAPHTHSAGEAGSTFWEIRLAARGAPPPQGAGQARRVFESEPLRGIPEPAVVSLIEVTVPPRGGETTIHTHPGPEFIYQLSGRIDYQNAIVGTKRLGPGGAEGIPPGTPVQKRNPLSRPASFLSLFLVDPDKPFAPKASF
ncbi:MAG: cupin domain-containing protein [Thermoleophilaceae bacterium]